MGPPPPRQVQHVRGQDWARGGGLLHGHSPTASFDHAMDNGASASYLAEELDFKYIDRKAPLRRPPARAPLPRGVYCAGGGGNGASRAMPYGGGLCYDEDAPSLLRRSVPASTPRDVSGWSLGERRRESRPKSVD